MPNPPLSHQELFSTSVPTLYFAPGIETKSGDSENFGCVGSISAPLLSLSLLGFLPLEGVLLFLWQSRSSQETGTSGIAPGSFWELLLSLEAGGGRGDGSPLQGSTRSSQLSFSLEKKGGKRVLVLLGKGEFWHQLQRNLPSSEMENHRISWAGSEPQRS